MQQYKFNFIKFCLENDVLRFGEFVLKSKRISPYFFNGGNINTGKAFVNLANFYASCISENFTSEEYDLLFGPAYKGITLATCAGIGLAQQGLNVPVSYNRKEVKDHGEGGLIVGASLQNKKILVIDDVITAGTTIKEAVGIAKAQQGKIIGIVIALNRQEIGLNSKLSAIEEAELEFNLKIASIICFDDLLEFIQQDASLTMYIDKMLQYRTQYGINN
ncbi:MAG: orotate phosphoribosyltransferase [Pseudomonadota bacterium]|nr:orotate phosphoribosyltransferase [Burkholderiales bacterium]